MKKLFAGGLFFFIGLFILLGFLAGTNSFSFLFGAISLLFFLFAPLAIGVFFIRRRSVARNRAREQEKKARHAMREKEVLLLARQCGGILTIPDVARQTSMTAQEAEEVLQEFVVKRRADMRLTKLGDVVYEFFDESVSTELREKNRLRFESLLE